MDSEKSVYIGPDATPKTLDQKLRSYSLGTHMELHFKVDGKQFDGREKGTLKSIDWNKRTLVLHNYNYDEDKTISLDKITFVESFKETTDKAIHDAIFGS